MNPPPRRPLLPADAAVTLRSLPRRFRAAAAPPRAGDETDDRTGDGDSDTDGWDRPEPDDRRTLDLVVNAVRSLTLLDRALEQVLVTDEPVLHPAVLDRHRRTFDVQAHGSVGEVLAELDDIALALAYRVERARPEDWHRTGRVAGHDAPVTALALVAEAVDTAVTDLRALGTAIHDTPTTDR